MSCLSSKCMAWGLRHTAKAGSQAAPKCTLSSAHMLPTTSTRHFSALGHRVSGASCSTASRAVKPPHRPNAVTQSAYSGEVPCEGPRYKAYTREDGDASTASQTDRARAQSSFTAWLWRESRRSTPAAPGRAGSRGTAPSAIPTARKFASAAPMSAALGTPVAPPARTCSGIESRVGEPHFASVRVVSWMWNPESGSPSSSMMPMGTKDDLAFTLSVLKGAQRCAYLGSCMRIWSCVLLSPS